MQAAPLLRLKFMHMRSALPVCTHSFSISLNRRKVSIGCPIPVGKYAPRIYVSLRRESYILSQFRRVFPPPSFSSEETPRGNLILRATVYLLRNVASPPFSTEDADVISERELGQTWQQPCKMSPLTSCAKTNSLFTREIVFELSTRVSLFFFFFLRFLHRRSL